MKHKIYSSILAAVALSVLPGCDKESSFLVNTSEGQLNCEALSVDYINRGTRTRAQQVDPNDFQVNFVNTTTNEVVRSFIYADMPEIVALPVGDYKAEAVYGDNEIDSEWENPSYSGSSPFSIEAGKITEDVEPITCSLKNIKVQVEIINQTGSDIIGDDVKVVVRAGKTGELTFDAEHIKNQDAGYFKYEENSTTIVADFSGTIDGLYTDGIIRTFNDACPGNAYKLNFTINRPDNMNPGDIQIGDGIKIDATITIKDENKVIYPNEPEDGTITDDMRPIDGSGTGEEPGTNPGDDDPGNDPGQSNLPEIIPEGFELGVPYTIDPTSSCVVKLISHAENGIQQFCLDIKSKSITDELLADVGLASHMDLTNPGDLKDGLSHPDDDPDSGLGLPVEFIGEKEVTLDVSKFMGILYMVGKGETHTFTLTLTDENGTTEKDIIIVVPA